MTMKAKNTKSFKVVAVSDGPNSFGLHGHILIAADGEAWEAGRNRYSPPERANQWNVGDVVEVPLKARGVNATIGWKLVFEPQWAEVGAETLRSLPKPPTDLLKQLWPDN